MLANAGPEGDSEHDNTSITQRASVPFEPFNRADDLLFIDSAGRFSQAHGLVAFSGVLNNEIGVYRRTVSAYAYTRQQKRGLAVRVGCFTNRQKIHSDGFGVTGKLVCKSDID